jgi:hypothetical protein
MTSQHSQFYFTSARESYIENLFVPYCPIDVSIWSACYAIIIGCVLHKRWQLCCVATSSSQNVIKRRQGNGQEAHDSLLINTQFQYFKNVALLISLICNKLLRFNLQALSQLKAAKTHPISFAFSVHPFVCNNPITYKRTYMKFNTGQFH